MSTLKLIGAQKGYDGEWHYAILDSKDMVLEFADESTILPLLDRGVQIEGLSQSGVIQGTCPLPCRAITDKIKRGIHPCFGVKVFASEYDSSYEYHVYTGSKGGQSTEILRNRNGCVLALGKFRVHSINGYDDTDKSIVLTVTSQGVLFPIGSTDKWELGLTDRVGSTAGGTSLVEFICSLGDSPVKIKWW